MFSARQGFGSAGFSGPAIVTGGTSYVDGAYTVRVFNSDDNLTISGNELNFDYFMVGAGGPGVFNIDPSVFYGGSSGGQNKNGTTVLSPGTYSITIGQMASTSPTLRQTVFSSVQTALGGSGSTTLKGADGFNGFLGGNGYSSGTTKSGGGGAGDGQSGAATTSIVSGNGGDGVTTNVSGVTSSTTSITIGAGSKTFTVASGLWWQSGMAVQVYYNGTNYMWGKVTSYSGTTLVINVFKFVGSGTRTSWTIRRAFGGGGAGNTTGAGSGYLGYGGGGGGAGINSAAAPNSGGGAIGNDNTDGAAGIVMIRYLTPTP